jgi:hypothetical protein
MLKIPVITDETGCAIASQLIPSNAVMTVMDDEFVTVYMPDDALPEQP